METRIFFKYFVRSYSRRIKETINGKLAIKVIMDYRIASAHEFRRRLGFKQYDIILIKEQ